MSTAPTPSTHASNAPTQSTLGKARHGATQESGGDLFANLLALLSSPLEPAADTAFGADTTAADEPIDALKTQDLAPDGSQNPLAALLGWTTTPALPGAPVAGNATHNGVNTNSLNATTVAGLPGATDPLPLSHPTLPAFTGAAAASTPNLQGAASAASAASSAQPGVGLQGMTPLASPTAPDAQTLLALSRATGGGAAEAPAAAEPTTGAPATSAASAGETAAPRSLHWRSTAGSTTTTTHNPTASHTAIPGQAPATETTQIARQALVAQSRSTVTLDERFGQSSASPASLATDNSAPLAAGARGSPQQDSGSGNPGGAPGQGGLDTTPETSVASNPEASAYAEATRELDDTSATHWGTSQLRHASLRVGGAGEDAIDIQLSMAGQEVQVDFRTDNPEARASLAQDASGSLGELLQRSGIQLGSVSVGAQHQQQGEPGRAPVPEPQQVRGRPAATTEAPVSTPPAPRPRSDGSRPLDLFV